MNTVYHPGIWKNQEYIFYGIACSAVAKDQIGLQDIDDLTVHL